MGKSSSDSGEKSPAEFVIGEEGNEGSSSPTVGATGVDVVDDEAMLGLPGISD